MSKFQIITLAVFVLCIVGGIVAFATYKGTSGSSQTLPPVTIWGTYPAGTFTSYVDGINSAAAVRMTINYVEKNPSTFNQEFVAALARGQGPDMVLVSADILLPLEDKLTLIPYTSMTQRSYLDTYIQEANIYLSANGILALPFSIDPMVMYWNRDMFNAAGVPNPPTYWSDFVGTSLTPGLVQKLTTKNKSGTISRTAIAMGDFTNMTNAREVLGTLILQLGNPVTGYNANGSLVSSLSTSARISPSPAVNFFTQFVDPTNAVYSWNRSMPNDKAAFLSGISATYFGFASELSDIRAKNPNLNFDVAPMPQVKSGGVTTVYGKMHGFSIVRTSPNMNADLTILNILINSTHMADLAKKLYLPSVLSALDQGSSDPYVANFDKAALIARTWLDIDPSQSQQIFGGMVDAVTSGQSSVDEAVNNSGSLYTEALRQATQ